MNYEHIYFQLITRGKTRKYDPGYDVHHMIPVSAGGPNCLLNAVYLTRREHQLAHLLLYRITYDRKNISALAFLGGSTRVAQQISLKNKMRLKDKPKKQPLTNAEHQKRYRQKQKEKVKLEQKTAGSLASQLFE